MDDLEVLQETATCGWEFPRHSRLMALEDLSFSHTWWKKMPRARIAVCEGGETAGQHLEGMQGNV